MQDSVIDYLIYTRPIKIPIVCTIKAQIQAIAHCHITTQMAHLFPISLLIDAMAATQGVYKRENTSRQNAVK